MRHLGFCDNLGGAKRTISRHFGRSEGDYCSAPAALNFECLSRDWFQLLWPQLEILFIRAFLNFGSTGGNRLATATVGAGEAAVTGFENEICRATWTLIPMNLLWR